VVPAGKVAIGRSGFILRPPLPLIAFRFDGGLPPTHLRALLVWT
jgi:hypothetical protein